MPNHDPRDWRIEPVAGSSPPRKSPGNSPRKVSVVDVANAALVEIARRRVVNRVAASPVIVGVFSVTTPRTREHPIQSLSLRRSETGAPWAAIVLPA